MHKIVFYSGPSENTLRFVNKLDAESYRLPLTGEQPTIIEPYILICPTYGGGAALMGRTPNYVPVQVKKFLKSEKSRSNCLAVISCGNRNFGSDFARAGIEIGLKLSIPVLAKVELAGTTVDVNRINMVLDSNIQI